MPANGLYGGKLTGMSSVRKKMTCLIVLLLSVFIVGSGFGTRHVRAESAEELRPFFSDSERAAMPEEGTFVYELVDKNGIKVPRQNGRGLMGLNAGFSNADVRQLEYEAPILAQQGINHLKMGMRPEGWGWSDWVKHQAVLERLGISSIWSYYAMCCEDRYYCRFLELPDDCFNTNTDLVTFENGTKGYFRGMGTLGNIFSSQFNNLTERVINHATAKFKPFSTVIGYQYTNEVQFGTGSYDPEARASWQKFVKDLFRDSSPASDTNGDGVYFNKTFGKNYRSWSEVEQFRGDDWKDHRKALLRDAWLGLSYARFVDRASQVAKRSNPNLLTGAMICVPLSPSVDLSLMLSMPNVSAAYINTYFCWLGGGLLMEAIADTYRKPVIASEINMPMGTYEQVRWGALTHLPYLEGFEWFYYSWAPKEAPGEHGGKYGFVDRWTIDTTAPLPEGEFKEPIKAVTYNERFKIIPQLAPFVGRLNADFNRRVLWISAGGYARDWLEDHEESGILRANVTSDIALVLAPKPLDLSGYKVIIYRNLQSPCISREIYRKLKRFVQSGGTVITGGYFIAANGTWLGEDNTRDWWQGLKLARASHSADGTTTVRYGKHTITTKGTFQYLVPISSNVKGVGEVEDSTGAKYPFLLTRKEGRGQWVYINLPYFFQLTEPFENYSPEKYADRFDCLRSIVEDFTGEVLADRYGTQWYAGEDCILAIRQARPGGTTVNPATPTGVAWKNGKYAMFEVFSQKMEGNRPYLEVKNGRIGYARELKPGEAKLWVVKPYGRPTLLYADGTLKNGAKIESGEYLGGRLKFRFAEQAFISSPIPPLYLKVDGKFHGYSYDPNLDLITIKRTGPPAEATLVFDTEYK